MKNYEKLIGLAKNGVILTQDLAVAGIGRDYLRYAVDDGVIENVARGVYLLKGELEDKLYVFQLRYERLIFSFHTSAFLLDLTTRDSDVFFVSAPLNYHNPNVSRLHNIMRESPENYPLGLAETNTPFGNPVRIHNAERTVCDLFHPQYAGDKFVQVETLKNYLQSPTMNLVTLFEYAKQLHVYNELKKRIEVLL